MRHFETHQALLLKATGVEWLKDTTPVHTERYRLMNSKGSEVNVCRSLEGKVAYAIANLKLREQQPWYIAKAVGATYGI